VLAGAFAFLGATAAPDPGWPRNASAVGETAARLGADAAEVGRRYLDSNAGEADRERLADLLTENLDPSAGDLTQQMMAAVRNDFRLGQTVTVDGWLLSRTEARICAIAYLAGEAA
jgi:hypothetical protein